jgi:muconolactone delta-isomerase
MRFMVLGAWDPTSPEIPRLLAQEQARTGELMEQGIVQQLVLRADGAGGYMIVDAESPEAVQAHLNTLPFMKAGIMQIELVELKA